MTRVLVVCLGNICRSPTAEAVLREKATRRDLDISVDSAGTGAWHIGNPPHSEAIAEGRRNGYDLKHLRARQFQPSDFTRFDLILGMDADNIND
ncbi:MAG: low molecular weight protein-tyrosine-phosphatase, partial [Pseudomonadota bacterium]